MIKVPCLRTLGFGVRVAGSFKSRILSDARNKTRLQGSLLRLCGENAEKPSTLEVSGFEGLIGEGFRFEDKLVSGCALSPRGRPSNLETVEESDDNFQDEPPTPFGWTPVAPILNIW